MKKIFIIILLFFFKINFVIADISIGFIDMNKIITTSKPGSSIIDQLNEINLKNLKKFKNDAKILKDSETKLISQKNILSEDDFQSKVNKLKIEIKKYNDDRNKINNDFNKLKLDSTNKLIKLINPILISYLNEKSISLILHKKDLIIGKKELDITDEIIENVNSEIKVFRIK
jgi:outer membrane protein